MSIISIDPTIVQAARNIYNTYLRIYSRFNKKPFGVVLNKRTFKGQLVFKETPILLPEEYFVPIENIKAQI